MRMIVIMTPRLLRRTPRTLAAVAAVAATALLATACGSGAGSGSTGAADVVTSFYPLEFATQQIVGDAMTVGVLTKPGTEPHDLELAPQDVAGMTKARLVVYADGFQPAVDDAMSNVDPSRVLDVADAAQLTLTATEDAHGAETEHTTEATTGDHASADPHFWLDPQRYAAVARAIGARLAQEDPARASTYEKNTDAFVARLTALDAAYASGLASCHSTVLVTSHAAFGYLAQRYGLDQHGIAGLSPDVEPSASALKEISDLVRSEGVTTIFQETLVEPHLSETVAASTGARIATLDPVEGITAESAGTDYFQVMDANLVALQKGLGCE
jgi:zinc transport system substrate-binding protein